MTDRPSPRDPYLSYKKTDLVNRLRKEMALRSELEAQYGTVLQDVVQRDIRIAELEAELVRYHLYFEQMHMTAKFQEHHP